MVLPLDSSRTNLWRQRSDRQLKCQNRHLHELARCEWGNVHDGHVAEPDQQWGLVIHVVFSPDTVALFATIFRPDKDLADDKECYTTPFGCVMRQRCRLISSYT